MRVLAGGVPRTAYLSDLSGSGCGIEFPRPLERGRVVRILLPAPGPGRFGFPPTLTARIVRSERVCGAIFTRIPARAQAALRALIEQARAETTPRPAPGEAPTVERRSDRRAYDARLHALASRVPHVLQARDLSTEGLRVDPLPWAEIGTRFEVSFAVPDGDGPMSVSAHVARHDDVRGTVLRFVDLEERQTEALRELLTLLPRLDDDRDVILLTEVA